MDLRDQLQATLGDAYALEKELGGGGMSRVFLAQESALGRKVVVKVLPPEMAAGVSIDRFRREIQLAAQLQHPHIVPLLSAGETNGLPFFTMPYVRGESLRARITKDGELPISESIRILREVASALAYAHENGIVHRDIKPENVLISGGSAVVTDFGVAKALSVSSGAPADSITSMGVALGTPAYMAPEQATADPHTDYRADIYAFGVLAYEMLTGSTPFHGRSPQATLAAHVTEKPDVVTKRRDTIPPLLASLVMSSLEKRPSDRPQSATELMHQLDALHTPSGGMQPTSSMTGVAPARPERNVKLIAGISIAAAAVIAVGVWQSQRGSGTANADAEVPVVAVLPFENLGRDEGRDFTDGMTEEITAKLSSLRGLKVIGRQSAKAYAGTTKTPQQIATELGVSHLLTGTVRWDRTSDGKDMVKVSPALLRGSDATQIWSQPYQTVISGIFEVQAKVAGEVANALDVALLQPERDELASRPTENVEAYGYYLRGMELARNTVEVPTFRAAITALEKAIELDEGFAAAHAWLGYAHTELYWFNGDRTTERKRKARAAIDRAFALEPDLPVGHFALGVYHYHAELDYDAAVRELSIYERARPSSADAPFYKAAIQRRQGKWDDAIANMKRAIELEPRMGANLGDLAGTYLSVRRYDESERTARQALIIGPHEIDPHMAIARVAIHRDGDVSKSVRALRDVLKLPESVNVTANVLIRGWPAFLDPELRRRMVELQWSPDVGEKTAFFMSKMMLHHYLGDAQRSVAYADSAMAAVRPKLRELPDEAQFHSVVAGASAILGRKSEAIAAADRAVRLMPVTKDAYAGADVLQDRAMTLVMVGEYERAITEYEQLLAIPGPVSRNWLRLHPINEPLRSNPRFQRLIR